jgi:hypothetical protein
VPIAVQVDHARRLVIAQASGILSDEEVFGYQRQIWSDPAVAGYDELVDMTRVEEIRLPSHQRARELAALSASMDRPAHETKFAIVAPQDVAFGLGRMYEMLREMQPGGGKQVAVFRTQREAMAFLGREGSRQG